MVKLFYWGSNEWGHAAIKAGNEYLSFHPLSRDKSFDELVIGVPSRFAKIDEDEIGRAQTVTSHSLDDDLVEEKIASMLYNEPQPVYSLTLNNCSHMVKKALLAGLSDEDTDFVHRIFGEFRQFSGRHIDHCGTIDEIADTFIDRAAQWAGFASRMRGPSRTAAYLAAGLLAGKRAAILSPADVVRFMQSH
ncbi:hypothetical protein [Caulobacter sp.]|uniref:hypothetical protein n=1 Tax=Caulobacter sp. TaxID=78 RepID=UPI003BAA4A1B